MMAATLPLELVEEIFLYLDIRSFYAARKVCRWWRIASCDTLTLARQLHQLPVRPLVDARRTTPRDLERLYTEAARKLLLGVDLRQSDDTAVTLNKPSTAGRLNRPRIAAVSRGHRTVTINGGQLALFDTQHDPPQVLLQRPLIGMIESARQVPWLQIAPTSNHALALSFDGGLLAVAQERTVQIYDLSTSADADVASRTIASAAGHYISGLDFEQQDSLLRVQSSGQGTVVYLGTPVAFNNTSESANMEHWTSKAGLRHTFLDSSLLQLTVAAASREYEARLGGLQLLCPFQNGFRFAAQKHGGNESSHYMYGHIRCSQPCDGFPTAAAPNSVTELARLESFLSAWDYPANRRADSGMGSWGDMPSAHEHHPRFALSEDGSLLVLAEREKKHVRHTKWTQLFLYRLPAWRCLEGLIRDREAEKDGRWCRLQRFLDRVDSDGVYHAAEEEMKAEKPGYSVARIPLAIGTLEGEVQDMVFTPEEAEGGSMDELTVTTTETSRRWQIVDA